MGRFKNIEIKGLLLEEFGDIFIASFNSAIKDSKLTEEEALRKIAPHFHALLGKYEENIASFYLDKNKFNLDRFLKSHFQNQTKIAKANKDSFTAFVLYINACAVIYEKIITKIKRRKIDSTLKMNIIIYGLILRRAQQIVDMLLLGHIDGSMIIWRSLYENAITLLVLALENDPRLADKYYQHSLRNSKKKVISYNKNFKELNFKPLPTSTEKHLLVKTQKLITEHGKDFLENEYGWADNLFDGKQKASFRSLEDRVEMSMYRPYYLSCCEHTHSNFNGVKNFMSGNKVILQKILDQEIDLHYFIDPMQFTLSVLHEINDYIIYEFSIAEELKVNMLFLRKIFERQQSTFKEKKKKASNII